MSLLGFLRVGRRRSQLPQAGLIGLLLAFSAVLLTREVWEAVDARLRAVDRVRRETVNLAWGASQQAAGAFQVAEMLVSGLADRVRFDGTDPAAIERLRRFMVNRVAESAVVDDLKLVDADGAVLAQARDSQRVSIADLGFFQSLRDQRGRAMVLGPVYRSSRTGRPVIPVGVRIERPDGSFSGGMTATIELDHFTGFYKTFELGREGAVALWRDDGVLLARQSLASAGAASDVSSVKYLFPAPESGTYDLVSPFDHVKRVLSYRRVAGFPVVVAMALGEDEQLAGWRGDAIWGLATTSVVALVLGLLGIRLQATAIDRKIAAAAVENSLNLTRLSRHLTEARDRAEGASRAKSRFLAGMSHELRTPLNGVLGYAQLLRSEGSLNKGQTARVDSMLMAGLHLLEMINSVLDLSEIEAGHAGLRRSRFKLAAVALACLDLVRPTAATKGLELILTVEPGTPDELFTDLTRLRQVILNLLGNGVKFTERGSVALRIGTAGPAALRIDVADTGPGISRHLRTQLFQEFERLGAEGGAIEGAGLGLALSAGIATLLGGRLTHEDNPGGGSVFRLELPLTLPHDAADTGQAAGASDQVEAPTAALRVLAVDDTAMNLDIVGCFLRIAGHAVTSADDGAKAVAAAAAADFDVILMDVRMPGVDGLEATRRIRALDGPRGRTPVVALTAQAFGDQIGACRAAGMDFHLAKPFTQEALQAVLAHAVATGPVADRPSDVAVLDGEAAPQAAGALPPVFDADVFEETAAFLSAGAVRSYLCAIADRGEQLMLVLRSDADASPDDLAEAAHTLAGTAAMFGFERTAAAARRFEHAARAGAPEVQALGARLADVIAEALPEMRRDADGADPALLAAACIGE